MTRTLILLIATLLTISSYHCIYSYCIYNHMSDNSELFIVQDSGQGHWAKTGRRFRHGNMGTGQKQCCPYTSRQCSAKPDKSNTCSFSFTYSRNGGKDRGPTFTTTCPAGGYIVTTGTFDNFSYTVYDADHNRLGGHEAHP